MRTKILVVLVAAAMLLAGISVIGSNMGFKISIPLYKFAAGTHTGLNWTSLPYYNGYLHASDVWTDISAISGVTTVELDQYQENASQGYPVGSYAVYDNDLGMDNFNVAPSGSLSNADSILVKINCSGTSVNWVVVGSHSPSLTVPLNGFVSGTHTGLNWRAIPYHTTAANAAALWTEINAVTPNTAVVELDQYQENGSQGFPVGSYAVYDNDLGMDNFAVTAGAPVLIKVSANKTWTPAHY